MNYQVHKNLRIAYILCFVSELFFPIAVWLFFYSRHLDFKQIAVMTAIGGLASILLEIPTGAFADIVGRKVAIVISYFLFSISMLLTAFTSNYLVFIALAVIGSLVNTLYSGSLEALVYDTLKEAGEESQYEHIASRMESINWVGLCLGGLIGGFLYTVGFRLPYIAQAIITLIAAIAALFLYEPHLDTKKYQMGDILKQNVKGFHELFITAKVSIVSLIFITIAAGYYIAASILGISQAKQYGMSPSTVGILFSTGYILSAIASYLYPKLKRSFGVISLLTIATSALLLSFLLANFVGVILGAGLIILRISSSTLFRNTRTIIFNRIFTSNNRATTLSTFTLLSELPYMVLAFFIGDYIDKTSPNSFALKLGLSLSAILSLQLFIYFFLHRRKAANLTVLKTNKGL